MENNLIVISVNGLPHKKMYGVLRSFKINPDFVFKSISADGLKFVPIRWQDYMIFSHKIKKIILLKRDGLFLFVGHSLDDETIIFNVEFSKNILKIGSDKSEKQSVSSNPKSANLNIDKIGRINMLLDGFGSLSEVQKKELDELSKKLN